MFGRMCLLFALTLSIGAEAVDDSFVGELLKSRIVKMASGDMPILGLGIADAASQGPPFTCADAVEAALQMGYRHIDTAAFYENHADIAEGIKRSGIPREEIWITSKIAMHGVTLQGKGSPGREATYSFVEDMLKELQTSYVDLVLTHFPNVEGRGLIVRDGVEMEGDTERAYAMRKEIWAALESLTRTGKVRNIGVSNYLVPHLEEMMTYATIMPALNQLELHPYLPRRDVQAFCQIHGIVIMAYGSIVQDVYPDLISESVVKHIAEAHDSSPGQVALAWALQRNIAVIPKSSKRARIKENAASLALTLSQDELSTLDALDCETHSKCRAPTRCGHFCQPGTYYWDPARVPTWSPQSHREL